MTGPDPLLVRLLADADPDERDALSTAFGAADTVARHLPAHAVPAAVRVAWLVHEARRADATGARVADALWRAVGATSDALADVAAPLVWQAPDTLEGL